MKKIFKILICLCSVLLLGTLVFMLFGRHKHDFGE